MKDEDKNLWDVCIAIGTVCVSLVTLVLGGFTFYKGEIGKVQLEHRLVLYRECSDYFHATKLKRLDTYNSMADLVALLVSASDVSQMKSALSAFRKEYYGRLLLVDEPMVRLALKHLLDDSNIFPVFVTSGSLRQEAIGVGDAMRKSISANTSLLDYCGSSPTPEPFFEFIRS